MANEIANYTNILNKTGLGKSSNECPNKTNILAISDEIIVNGTYTNNQCVLLDHIVKEIPRERQWVLEIINNTNEIAIIHSDGEVPVFIRNGESISVNVLDGNYSVTINLQNTNQLLIGDNLTFYGYHLNGDSITNFSDAVSSNNVHESIKINTISYKTGFNLEIIDSIGAMGVGNLAEFSIHVIIGNIDYYCYVSVVN